GATSTSGVARPAALSGASGSGPCPDAAGGPSAGAGGRRPAGRALPGGRETAARPAGVVRADARRTRGRSGSLMARPAPFPTVRSEGGLVPPDLLQRVVDADPTLGGF